MTDAAAELHDIQARLKKLADDENCSICKEDLTLASKGVEASAIKLGRMNSLVKELEGKDLMSIDETLRDKYVPKRPEPAPAKRVNAAAGLGVDDVLIDVADMLEDVKDLTSLSDLLPQPPGLPGLSPRGTTGQPRQILKRPPLPHEVLLGIRE